jgi:hypothetical protein
MKKAIVLFLCLLFLPSVVGATTSIYPGNFLDDIDDVSASSPVANDILNWSGTAWVNRPVFEINEITDVSTSGKIVNDILIWNGTSWKSDDNLIVNSITYGNTYWEDKTISIVSTVLGPTAPDLETFIQNTLAYAWSDSVASEAVHLNVQTPHAKKLSTDLDAHIHGNAGANTNSGNVEAILECTNLVNMDGTFSNSTTVYNAVIAVDGTAYKNYYADFGDIDGSGATKVSALMQCRLTRNVSTAGDLTGDFFFLDVDFHYQIDTPGSETEDAK